MTISPLLYLGMRAPATEPALAPAATPEAAQRAGWSLEDVELPRGIPVEVVAEESGRTWLIDYRGGIALREDGLHLELWGQWGRPNPDVPGLLGIAGWGFGLAESSPAGFALVAEAIVPGDDRLTAGRDWMYTPPSSFSLGGIRKEDLVDRWPVIFHDIRFATSGPYDYPPSAPSTVREYVHLPRNVFADLLGPRGWLQEPAP